MVTGADPGAQAFSGRISLGLRRPSRDLIHHPYHSILEYPYIQILNFHLSILSDYFLSSYITFYLLYFPTHNCHKLNIFFNTLNH